MTSPILVTGGTGTLGRLGVRRLRYAGTLTGRVPDIAGPQMYSTAGLLRGYLRATHRHRPIIPVRLPGKAARPERAGANLAPGRAWATGAGRSSSRSG